MKLLIEVRNSIFVILITLSAVPALLAAEPFEGSRHIKLELDEVSGATGYQVELFKNKTSEIFSIDKPFWDTNLAPDHYQIRIRTLDERGEAGPWGEKQSLDVFYSKPRIISPADNSKMLTKSEGAREIKFHWEGPTTKTKYHL